MPLDKKFQAYLYDCDGTLADTMEAHAEAWVATLAKHGCKLEKSLIYELAGMPGPQNVSVMNQRFGWGLNPHAVSDEKEELFFTDYLHRIKPIEAVVQHLLAQVGHAKIAVVSGGKRKIIEQTLQIIGVRNFVELIISAEDVQQGKPNPEPFLKAAAGLGVSPAHCLVFEDAEFGFQAAQAAGMQWIKVIGSKIV